MSVEVKRASSEEIPNLRLPEFHEVDCLETDLDMEVFVVPTISSAKIQCPFCGCSETISHGKEERFFRDWNIYEKRVGVTVNGRRYKCKNPECGKTFALNFECIDRLTSMSKPVYGGLKSNVKIKRPRKKPPQNRCQQK